MLLPCVADDKPMHPSHGQASVPTRSAFNKHSWPAEPWRADTEAFGGGAVHRGPWPATGLRAGAFLDVLRRLRWPMRVLTAWGALLVLARLPAHMHVTLIWCEIGFVFTAGAPKC